VDHQRAEMFSYLSPEVRVRKDHPLRAVRSMTDGNSERHVSVVRGDVCRVGRPSIPPERLLRAQLLQMFFSVRSERLLMDEIDYSILYRWFVGLNLDETVWDATTFTKNRDRLLEAVVAKEFLAQVVEREPETGLISDEHFAVDGTLLEAWASLKSFRPKNKKQSPTPDDPGNPTVDFHGEKRSNQMPGRRARQRQGGEVELRRESSGGEPQRADRQRRTA
jgi:transposase